MIMEDLQAICRDKGVSVCAIDPGTANWAYAFCHSATDYELTTRAFRKHTLHLVHGTLIESILNPEFAGDDDCFDVVSIEQTWHGKASRKTVADLNQSIGIMRAWAYRQNAEVVDVPVLNGWQHDIGVQGTTPKQKREAAKRFHGIDVKTEHEACAVMMLGWTLRRIR